MTFPGPMQSPQPNFENNQPQVDQQFVPQKPTSQRLAIWALILGAVAFCVGWIPVVGALFGAGAIVLGVFALKAKQRKGLFITGAALGALAVITSVLMTIAVANVSPSTQTASAEIAEKSSTDEEAALAAADKKVAADKAAAEKKSADKKAADKKADDKKAAEQKAADKKAADKKAADKKAAEQKAAEQKAADEKAAADAKLAETLGEVGNPHPQPYIAEGIFGGEKYSLTASILDANAGGLVASWNMFNSEAPAGFKYVVVEISMTGIDPDGVNPTLANSDLELATAEGNRYDDEFVIFGDGMPSMSDGPELYPGSVFTGYTAYIVPETAESFLLHDNGEYVAL